MQMNYSSAEFESLYTYHGSDLGAVWGKDSTTFRVWAPSANNVKVNLYQSGTPGGKDLIRQVKMQKDVCGTWVAQAEGDLNGVYYTYAVTIKRRTVEACDPYARATGVNGCRAMVIDLASTDPPHWQEDADPHQGMPITDAVIAEVHIRDMSVHPSAASLHPGKYLGMIESGRTTPSGIPIGIDHFKELGVTHLHILPMYDFGSVDESRSDIPQYNWGYDPVNFNVPEGSYSSDPYHGQVRVAEMKQMVQGLHSAGISVVMDVVYNHVYQSKDFCFNKIVPQYFSRVSDKGVYSNGSVCGNDTASERAMVRKYIVDSVCYWAEEYHIDGFRFDLAGLIDTDTINAVMEAVHRKRPGVIFYGEGWSMDTKLTKPEVELTTQNNSALVPGFAFFSDTIRDALRGSVFDTSLPGFAAGAITDKNTLHNCYMGVPYWANDPVQSINYISCHDNHTLFDRLTLSAPGMPRELIARMNKLAAAFCLTAQGVPFFQAGEEMLRSKPDGKGGLEGNSYRSPDSVNAIDWSSLEDALCMDVYQYYRGLLAFRRAHSVLRLADREDVLETVTPIHCDSPYVVAFGMDSRGQRQLLSIFNAGFSTVEMPIPGGKWNVYVNALRAGNQVLGTVEGRVFAEPMAALILAKAPEE